jgi:hypothetical protein
MSGRAVDEARQEALDARRKMFEEYPDRKPTLPEEILKASEPGRSCSDLHDAATLAYGRAAAIYLGLETGDGDFWWLVGTWLEGQYNSCLMATMGTG